MDRDVRRDKSLLSGDLFRNLASKCEVGQVVWFLIFFMTADRHGATIVDQLSLAV